MQYELFPRTLSTIQGNYPRRLSNYVIVSFIVYEGNFPQSTIQGNYPRRCHMKTFCPGRWIAASQWARPVSVREWAPSWSSHSSRSASRFQMYLSQIAKCTCLKFTNILFLSLLELELTWQQVCNLVLKFAYSRFFVADFWIYIDSEQVCFNFCIKSRC